MNYISYTKKKNSFFGLFFILISITSCTRSKNDLATTTTKLKTSFQPMALQIIVGSIRNTPTGEKIAENIKNIINKNSQIKTEIIKIKDYNLPFYVDETAPASREGEITDPILKKWSDKIKEADAYIIIVPEYNASYPGPLKNALDSIYLEWKDKPVAFVGYSGGPSGGASAISQLKHVTSKGLNMIPIDAEIKIPESWRAF